ncbi:hypothetical protein [Nonomuraea sp. SYSU D8015]|uniref:hypothetical protein n=1 Tax=Nonomuraea sp. SYSU D8015 TaxID=2593644 RepID=UPI001660F0D8|nr:hypothetical protein [Nonomuraea sp. SYSU D8015]
MLIEKPTGGGAGSLPPVTAQTRSSPQFRRCTTKPAARVERRAILGGLIDEYSQVA